MIAIASNLPEVIIIEPDIFEDDRGFFFESFNQKKFSDITGSLDRFVQDNHSRSKCGVLRGLHYQINEPQGKLVRVTAGEVFDVAVDLRKSSINFGKWIGVILSAKNRKQLWIPKGFAHGFLVLSDVAECVYKTTGYYSPQHERSIAWNDPDLAISWPIKLEPVVSQKDRLAKSFKDADLFE